MIRLAAIAFAAITAAFYQPRYLPDPAVTPGAVNPAVTQQDIRETICRRGWTATVRPPEAYTERLKRQQLYGRGSSYRALGERLRDYEEDHLIPLEAGGSPDDPRNLWPEPRFGEWSAAAKDHLEREINWRICHGRMTLAEGQAAFMGDWTEAYRRYLGEPQDRAGDQAN